MQQRMIKVNPSEETIKIGPLRIHFLLTSEDHNGKELGDITISSMGYRRQCGIKKEQ